MAIWAIISESDYTVENITVWDGETDWSPPSGYFTVNVDGKMADIGDSYNPSTGEFTPPPSEQPQEE